MPDKQLPKWFRKYIGLTTITLRDPSTSPPIECAILHGLGNMRTGDLLFTGQVSNRPGDFENAGVSASAEAEALHGVF